jgi:broad specificity phosphatase PhoE
LRRLVLARHAETDLNVRAVLNGDPRVDGPLTERGRLQARALGRQAGAVDLVVHTEFQRTRETATLAWPGAPTLTVPELNEIRFGRFEGTRWTDGYDTWVLASGPQDPCPGGGESRLDALRRYVRGYRGVLERPEETVAVVAHGAHVRYIALALERRAPQPVLENVPPATPLMLARDEFERAIELIEAWLHEPRWP